MTKSFLSACQRLLWQPTGQRPTNGLLGPSALRSVLWLAVLLSAQAAYAADDQFFADVKSVGQGLLTNLMWISGMGATLGFIMAGHAFSSGDVERGKTMLRGTIIGAVCIFGSVSLVHFIQNKFSVSTF